MLCFAVHPQLDQKDQRYQTATEGSMDSCLTQYQVQTEVDSAAFYGKEWRGVLHLVQGWIQQAQPEKLMLHSLSLVPGAHMQNITGTFFVFRIYLKWGCSKSHPMLV